MVKKILIDILEEIKNNGRKIDQVGQKVDVVGQKVDVVGQKVDVVGQKIDCVDETLKDNLTLTKEIHVFLSKTKKIKKKSDNKLTFN